MEYDGFTHVNGFHIYGRIDRIDYHPETQAWRVYDYKTFDKARSPQEKHLEHRSDIPESLSFLKVSIQGKRGLLSRSWADLQLPLYREFIRTGIPQCLPGARIELAYALLPSATGDTKISVWSDYSDALHESAMNAVSGILDCLKRDTPTDYWPPRKIPSEFDDYRHIVQSLSPEYAP